MRYAGIKPVDEMGVPPEGGAPFHGLPHHSEESLHQPPPEAGEVFGLQVFAPPVQGEKLGLEVFRLRHAWNTRGKRNVFLSIFFSWKGRGNDLTNVQGKLLTHI